MFSGLGRLEHVCVFCAMVMIFNVQWSEHVGPAEASWLPTFHGSEKDMRTNILAASVDWSHKSRWRKVSEDAVDFVKCLLVKDPVQRMDVGQALEHKWLKPKNLKEPHPVLDRDSSERFDATQTPPGSVVQFCNFWHKSSPRMKRRISGTSS